MLEVDQVSKSFGGSKVLDGVSFSVPEGSLIGLIGPSGGGKSTLMKIMGGVMRADQGSLKYPTCNQEEISLMFQEGALFDSLTVFENVAFPLVRGDVPVRRSRLDEIAELVEASLERVGLVRASAKFPAQLSGGMRRRVSLARALVARPKIVFLDDPTCGLDPVASSVIMELVSSSQQEDRSTMIVAGHDLRRLLPLCSQFLALFDQQIKFQGTASDLLASDLREIIHFVECRYDFAPHAEVGAP